jgi:hypothetical protein
MSCSPEVVVTDAKRGSPEMRGALRWHRGHKRASVTGVHHKHLPELPMTGPPPSSPCYRPHLHLRCGGRPRPHARAQRDGAWLPVAVLLRKPEATRRCSFGIELDQHRFLLAYHPGVMPRLHDYHLGRDAFEDTAIGIRATHVAPG